MIHISGFLKVIPKDGGILQSNVSTNNKNFTMPLSMPQNYQVLGLMVECHLIESPAIMELTIHFNTFSATTSLDMNFTSVDVR